VNCKLIKYFLAAALYSTPYSVMAAYPEKPIQFVVPYAPGGTTDLIARVVAPKLGEILGQPVVIINKPGAGGAVGSAYAAKERPDGYTIVMAVESSHAVNPSVQKIPSYDPLKDFSPISNLANVLGVLDVSASSDIKTFDQLIRALKNNPGKMAYGSSGNGGYSHLFGQLFSSVTQTDMLHVPYKGLGPAMIDLLAGQIQVIFDNLPSSASQIEAGNIRALAVASPTRVKSMPEVPTYAEVGYPQLNTPSWFGLAAPAGVPENVLEILNQAVKKVLQDPGVMAQIEKQGAVADYTSRNQFTDMIRASNKQWQDIVAAIKFEKI
jgi:tripartite-type tricarboxylate transporter receptor subunit TctC